MRHSHYIITLCTAAAMLLSVHVPAYSAGQTDPDSLSSSSMMMTQEDINMVMQVFDGSQPYEIIGKVDGFINTGKTEEETAAIAYYIYTYYRTSRIMGYDEIAIYVADKYFLNGKFKTPDESSYMEMKLFADMNRHSLIGMPAPSVTLQDPAGTTYTIPEKNGYDYAVIYFYDDECPGCIKATPGLMQYLSRNPRNLNITVYMVYTQDDRERWMNYIAKAVHPFKLPENINVIHLWDPETTSGYVTSYGVISTPKLFVTDRDGIIIGRELTPSALSQVIDVHESTLNSTEMVLDQLFAPMANNADTTEIIETIDAFFQDSKDNPDFFHELFYTMYQYLKTSPSYTLQQGAAYLANKYIAGMPEMWESVEFIHTGVTEGSKIRADYSSVTEFLDQTALAVLMFYRNPLDKPVTDLELRTANNKKMSIYGVKARYTVLYFYNTDCQLCNAVSEALDKLQEIYPVSDVQIVGIYTGTDNGWKKYIKDHHVSWINLWDKKRTSGMFDKYDLLDVPAIYLLDENKITLAKDINPDVLGALLEYYLNEE